MFEQPGSNFRLGSVPRDRPGTSVFPLRELFYLPLLLLNLPVERPLTQIKWTPL